MAALAAYSNSFRDGLAFDSQRLILADSRIQADTPDNVHQIWSGDYYNGTGSGALYRPLTTLSYLWNYAGLGDGPNAPGYHAVNFLLHAANAALVYLLGLAVFAEAWPAFAMAALWALHPVLTESVTNVAGRADLLAAFGVLAGLLCLLRAGSAVGWRRWAWTSGLAASSAIAIFSKESGVVLIAMAIASDIAFRPATPRRTRIASYLAILVPAAIFFAMRQNVLAQVSSLLISYCDNPLQGAGFLDLAPHRFESSGRVSRAPALARTPLSRLLLQSDRTLHLYRPYYSPRTPRLDRHRGSRGRRLAPRPARALLHRVLRHRHRARRQPDDSRRQHHGRALSRPAGHRIRRRSSLVRARAAASCAAASDGRRARRRLSGVRRAHLGAQRRLARRPHPLDQCRPGLPQ